MRTVCRCCLKSRCCSRTSSPPKSRRAKFTFKMANGTVLLSTWPPWWSKIAPMWRLSASTASFYLPAKTIPNFSPKNLTNFRTRSDKLKAEIQTSFTTFRGFLRAFAVETKTWSARLCNYLKLLWCCNQTTQHTLQNRRSKSACKVTLAALIRLIRGRHSSMKATFCRCMEWSTVVSNKKCLTMQLNNLNSCWRWVNHKEKVASTPFWRLRSSGDSKATKQRRSACSTPLWICTFNRPKHTRPTSTSTSNWMLTFWWSWPRNI